LRELARVNAQHQSRGSNFKGRDVIDESPSRSTATSRPMNEVDADGQKGFDFVLNGIIFGVPNITGFRLRARSSSSGNF
jgi:hypothetical protein